jgi:metal-responsive CopG/Arc/MetJ family transcriptional regulator
MQNTIPVGVSLPERLLKQVDALRGDVTRSKYLQRLLEKIVLEEKIKQDSLDGRLRDLQSSESGDQ